MNHAPPVTPLTHSMHPLPLAIPHSTHPFSACGTMRPHKIGVIDGQGVMNHAPTGEWIPVRWLHRHVG